MKQEGKKIKRSSVPFVLCKSCGKMKLFKDEIYSQPSSKKQTNLFFLVGPPGQKFTIWSHRILKEFLRLEKTLGIKSKCQFSTTTKGLLGLFPGVNVCSGSGRKVFLCPSFICSSRHLLSRSDLKLRQRLFIVSEEISFRLFPPWIWHICPPSETMSELAVRAFPGLLPFFQIILPNSPVRGAKGGLRDLNHLEGL